MAGHVKRYTAVQTATTIAASGTMTTKRVPCKYALMVIARVSSGTSEALASAVFNIANGSAQTPVTTAGQGLTEEGTLPVTLSQADGQKRYLRYQNGLPIPYDWAMLVCTASAGGIAGPLNVDIEVYYASEADYQRAEQVGLAAV